MLIKHVIGISMFSGSRQPLIICIGVIFITAIFIIPGILKDISDTMPLVVSS